MTHLPRAFTWTTAHPTAIDGHLPRESAYKSGQLMRSSSPNDAASWQYHVATGDRATPLIVHPDSRIPHSVQSMGENAWASGHPVHYLEHDGKAYGLMPILPNRRAGLLLCSEPTGQYPAINPSVPLSKYPRIVLVDAPDFKVPQDYGKQLASPAAKVVSLSDVLISFPQVKERLSQFGSTRVFDFPWRSGIDLVAQYVRPAVQRLNGPAGAIVEAIPVFYNPSDGVLAEHRFHILTAEKAFADLHAPIKMLTPASTA